MREYRSKWASVYTSLREALGASTPAARRAAAVAARDAASVACRGPKRGRSLGAFVARVLDTRVIDVRLREKGAIKADLLMLNELAAREAGLRFASVNRHTGNEVRPSPLLRQVLVIYKLLTQGLPESPDK